MGALLPTVPPASWIARLAMTSFAFMFDCVPDPVWNTTSGNSASHLPSITSCAACAISCALSRGSTPSSALARAAACLTTPNARTTGRPNAKRATPIGKLSTERCVCAPHSRCAGTGTSPRASFSMRVVMWTLLGSREGIARWRQISSVTPSDSAAFTPGAWRAGRAPPGSSRRSTRAASASCPRATSARSARGRRAQCRRRRRRPGK